MGGWKDYLRKMLGWWSATEAADVAIPPFRISAGQVYAAGAAAAQLHHAGADAGQVYFAGTAAGQARVG